MRLLRGPAKAFRFGKIGSELGHNSEKHNGRSRSMTSGTIVLIVLILLLIGAFPAWPHSKSWGYYPSGGLGLVVVVVLILVLIGRI